MKTLNVTPVRPLEVGSVESNVTKMKIQAMFDTTAYLLPNMFLSRLLFPLEVIALAILWVVVLVLASVWFRKML